MPDISIDHKRFSLYYFLFLAVVILLSTTYIWFVLYWNDEWRSVADVFVLGINALSYRGQMVSFTSNQIWELLIQGRFFGTLLFNRLLHVSPYEPYRIIFLILMGHIMNSFLIFFILKRSTKNIVFSVIASLFFALSSIHMENFLWLGAGFYNILSMTFALITLVFLQYISLKRNFIFCIFAFFTAFIAYEWKENCAFLFLFIPAYFLVVKNDDKRRMIAWYISVFAFIAIFLVALSNLDKAHIANMQNGFGKTAIAKICFNLIFYPIANLSHNVIPYSFIMEIRQWLSYVPERFFVPITTLLGVNSNLLLFDSMSLLFTLVVIVILYRIYKTYPNFRTILLIGLLWHIFSMSPLSVRLVTRYNGYLTYSYLYHQLFSAGIFFSCIVVFLIDGLKRKISIPIIQIFVLCYFSLHIYLGYYNSQSVVLLYRRSKKFISLFQSFTQRLPDKPIFYIYHPTIYSLNSISARLPFMLGSGFILSILSYPSGAIPSDFLITRYLEPFDSQGYMEQGNKGYGFFWNFDDLKKEFIGKPDLSVDQVIALIYSANGTELTDISEMVRDELKKDRTKDPLTRRVR